MTSRSFCRYAIRLTLPIVVQNLLSATKSRTEMCPRARVSMF